MSDNGLGNIDGLFRSAQGDGLTGDTMDLVVSNLNSPTMTSSLVGVSLGDLASNDVTLAMNVIDASGSMGAHAADLIRAYNEDYLDTMARSPAGDDILVSTIRFDDRVELVHGYLNLADVPPLTRRRYDPGGTTALYDAVAAGLTNMVLYAQQLRQNGVMVRCIVIVYSDGQDNASRQTAQAVRRAARELLKQEIYTLAYVGFRSGGISDADVRRLADTIGFPEALAAGISPEDLRRIFRMASLSTIRTSRQGAAPAGVFTQWQ